MNRELLSALAVSLLLTLVFETGFFLLIGKRDKKDLLLVIFVNIITNPVVVLLYWLIYIYTNVNLAVVKMALELFAILAEGYYYKRYSRAFKRPYLFSAAANAFSFGMGVLFQQII